MKKNTRIYLAALVLFVAGTGFLVYTGLAEGSAYHLEVADALAMPGDTLRNARVFGVVSSTAPIRRQANGLFFTLEDQTHPEKSLDVAYTGAVPDNFKPGAQLYAEGGRRPGSAIFEARGLVTTCPSKYTTKTTR